MAKMLIEDTDAQAILDYLTTQPYRLVFRLIPVLVGLHPAPEVAPEPEPPIPTRGPAPIADVGSLMPNGAAHALGDV